MCVLKLRDHLALNCLYFHLNLIVSLTSLCSIAHLQLFLVIICCHLEKPNIQYVIIIGRFLGILDQRMYNLLICTEIVYKNLHDTI
jgi:hypothetical protein